ncbi:DUF1571 domain-containing protein [Stieleria sp. ICT_E10.1]|uniref:DUF1571 domain-containing protein n=1 Tax=Stieleria sedimenti TaxID=2976331 RepID=UPI0021802452|nr:DUF1571 domain-containing protein [Stieleria sedimenti]MCS7467901.1 DUF1571 domain-containing protein [Stieleria sedimenti]
MTVRATVTIILLISTSAVVHAEPPHAATVRPSEGSDQPVLQEEYIYRDLKLNVALSDEEFESDYSTYKFR